MEVCGFEWQHLKMAYELGSEVVLLTNANLLFDCSFVIEMTFYAMSRYRDGNKNN